MSINLLPNGEKVFILHNRYFFSSTISFFLNSTVYIYEIKQFSDKMPVNQAMYLLIHLFIIYIYIYSRGTISFYLSRHVTITEIVNI